MYREEQQKEILAGEVKIKIISYGLDRILTQEKL